MVIQPFNFSRRFAVYSPVSSNSSSAGRTAAASPPKFLSRGCYSLAEVLSSRRFRLLVIPVVVTLLFFIILGLGLPTPGITAKWSQAGPNGQAPVTAPDAPAGYPGTVDWSRFAYNQYVTNSDYLCNSVMLFERLHNLGSRADRIMMYPSSMLDPEVPSETSQSNDARLLLKARDEYNVHLVPIRVQHRDSDDSKFYLSSKA